LINNSSMEDVTMSFSAPAVVLHRAAAVAHQPVGGQ